MCVDMTAANKAIKREHYLGPTLMEMIHELHVAQGFIKVDLRQGYNQLELDEGSRYITTFALISDSNSILAYSLE